MTAICRECGRNLHEPDQPAPPSVPDKATLAWLAEPAQIERMAQAAFERSGEREWGNFNFGGEADARADIYAAIESLRGKS